MHVDSYGESNANCKVLILFCLVFLLNISECLEPLETSSLEGNKTCYKEFKVLKNRTLWRTIEKLFKDFCIFCECVQSIVRQMIMS